MMPTGHGSHSTCPNIRQTAGRTGLHVAEAAGRVEHVLRSRIRQALRLPFHPERFFALRPGEEFPDRLELHAQHRHPRHAARAAEVAAVAGRLVDGLQETARDIQNDQIRHVEAC
jgi:hypothetical protein